MNYVTHKIWTPPPPRITHPSLTGPTPSPPHEIEKSLKKNLSDPPHETDIKVIVIIPSMGFGERCSPLVNLNTVVVYP